MGKEGLRGGGEGGKRGEKECEREIKNEGKVHYSPLQRARRKRRRDRSVGAGEEGETLD